jgi:hypothetical protein
MRPVEENGRRDVGASGWKEASIYGNYRVK